MDEDNDAEQREDDVSANAAQPTSQGSDTNGAMLSNTVHSNRESNEKDDINDTEQLLHENIKTLDGNIAGDEFDADAINYQILLGKIDSLLEKLNLDA